MQVVTDSSNGELFDTLKRWRDMACEESGLPIYMVANLQTLKELSTYLPLNKKDLLKIAGFGKAKVDKYGDEILEAIESYCSRHSLASNMDAKPLDAKKEARENKVPAVKKVDTKLLSFNLFKEGKTLADIAAERNLTSNTIEGHLAHYVGIGEIDINDMVPLTKQQLIRDAVKIHGALSHKTLIENLPSDISYGQIKMVLAAEEK
jgi:ATP-dependent DNA helicase RecQ